MISIGNMTGAAPLGAALTLGLTLIGGPTQAQTPPAADPSSMEWTGDLAVSIDAHRHGPALWRVSKAETEAWVLAVPEAATLKDWDASSLQKLFDSVKQVRTAPRAQVNVFGVAWFLLKGEYRLPKGQTLDALLGPDDWGRLSRHLRAAKANPEDYRHLQPGYAVIMAWSQMAQARKAGNPSDAVGRLAEKRHLPVKPVAVYAGGPLLSKLAQIPPQDGVACLRQTLDDLDFAETHLEPASLAWSHGDLAGLRQHYRPEHGFECIARTEGLSSAVERSVRDTAHDIAEAMYGPPTLFVLSLGSFVRKGGVIDALRAQGYRVEEPGA